MLPRWHIIWGFLFTAIIWFFAPEISFFNLSLIFFSSFLIDIDHYITSIIKTKKFSLLHSFKYYEDIKEKTKNQKAKGIRKKGDFHLFHTIEFHILIGLIGIFYTPFFYVFIGMSFHSFLDLFYLLYNDVFFVREYFLFSWSRRRFSK